MIFDKNSANSQMFNQFKLTGDEAALNLTGSIMVGNPNSRYGHYEIRQTNNGARYLYDNTKVLQDGKYVSANPGGVYGPEIYPQLGPGGNISDLVAALNQNIMQFAQFDDQQVNARRKK
jgi:archaellum component FlaF (FlaF/FlaG flagellin family)